MKVYADNAATTALSKAAINAITQCMEENYGNPSSVHSAGRQAAKALESSRKTIAGILGAAPNELYFTSGGTESDNWAINAAAELGAREGKRHIISTAFEHHAVLHTLNKLEKQGYEITFLPVNSDGIVRTDDLERAIRGDTALVTIMYANNEVGTVQPVPEIGMICRDRKVIFHTDAVQAAGHLEIDVNKQCIDMLSISAHKFHGPKGTGALYCKKGIKLLPFIEGGAQERGKRAGTENVPGIAGMAAALEDISSGMRENNDKVESMRDKLINGVLEIEKTRLNGHAEKRLPGIASFCFEGIEGEAILLMLDLAGINASSGSACTSGSLDPSHVLLAMGIPHEIAHGSLRISLCEYNTSEEIDYILETLPQVVGKLRAMSPVWNR